MIFEQIFNTVHFVEKYKLICLEHNDYDNGLIGSNKTLFLEILKNIDDEFIYIAKDRLFKLDFQIKNIELNLGLTIKDGLIEPRLYFIENGEWLIYNRFDFIAEELNPGFRQNYNIPKYISEAELVQVLKKIFSIYLDIKSEVTKLY